MVNAINAAITAKASRHRGLPGRPEGVQRPDRPRARPGASRCSPTTPTAPATRTSGWRTSARICTLSGYDMGQRIVDLVGSGDVALFIATPGQLNIQPRIDGAIAAIKKFGKRQDQDDGDRHRPAPPRRAGEDRRLLPRSQEPEGDVRRRRRLDAGRRPGHAEVRASRRRASRPAATTWGRPP